MPAFGVQHEITLGRAERFQRDRDAKLSASRHGGVQHFGRVRFGIVVGNARQQIALLGRAEYHDVPAQVGTDFRERAEIVGSPTPHRGIGAGEIEAVGLRQQPVQADDFQPGVLGHRPNFDDPLRRHPPHIKRLHRRGERERGDFHARVTEFADCGKCVGERTIAEHFVAESEFHLTVFDAMTSC